VLSFGSPTRRKSPALLVFLLLGFTVFLWGIQYKLSLYRSEAVQRAIPAAKLLSQKERPSSSVTLAESLLPVRSLPPAPQKISASHSAQELSSHFGEVLWLEGMCGTLFAPSLMSRNVVPSRPRAPPIAA
jgi:hypothetical protein